MAVAKTLASYRELTHYRSATRTPGKGYLARNRYAVTFRAWEVPLAAGGPISGIRGLGLTTTVVRHRPSMRISAR